MKTKEQIKANIIANLFSKHRMGIKPGLERTITLAEAMGNPQNSYDTIHVAGTNGKGSTCSVASSLLIESGLKVGLYTSPHIKDFNERIRVNGIAITDDELIEYAEKLLPIAEEMDATFFEITTVMAFMYFADEGVDVAVIETGMGGQFDSTNIINPKVCVITDIDMDHEEFLGDTIEKIAFEKAGIIKPNTPIITTNEVKNVLSVISDKATKENAELVKSEVQLNDEVLKTIRNKFISHSFIKNYAAALLACEVYLGHPITTAIQTSAITNIEKNSGYFARLQMISNDPVCILDISHSVAAAKNLVESLQSMFKDKKWTIILALMNDKDYRGIIDELAVIAELMILTQVENERSMSAIDLSYYAESKGINSMIMIDPKMAKKFAFDSKLDCIITGSFYLAAEVF
ncbi:MAG: folylpolyglutamate synthase/dihydrofolate synthase family protein [Candidatus Kapaibacterium sp.]